MHWDTSERFWQGPLTGGTQGHCSKWDKLGCIPSGVSVLGHFPAFRPWLRAGVVGAAAAAVLLTVGAALGSATSPL